MPEAIPLKQTPNFQVNKYFVHKLKNGRRLLITELGRFVSLDEQEFKNFKEWLLNKELGQLNKELFQKLEDATVIITEKSREQAVNDYKIRYSHVSESISLHIVNPTMRCNQNCLYCYAKAFPLNAKGQDMDEKTALKVLDFIWQGPMKNIVIEFQGGEPLANFPIIEFMVNEAGKRKGKNIHWRIVSNLSLLDETIASFLQKNKIFDVCTSLDGPKKVHDKNRPFSGGSGFDNVIHWVNTLRNDFGFEHLGALCTVTKNSLPYAKEIVDTYLDLDFHDITAVPIRKIGLAEKNWDKIGYSWEKYTCFWEETVDYCIELTKQGKTISEQCALFALGKMNKVEPSYHTCFSKPCGAALIQCSYQPNGDIYTCDEAKAEPIFKIGNVSQTYKEVLASPSALNMVSLSSSLGFLCNECKFTGFCSICPVLMYCTQGNFVPKLSKDDGCKIKKAQFTFLLEKLFGEDRAVLDKWVKANN